MPAASDTPAAPAQLHWLDTAAPAALPTGASFGLPWARGAVDRTTSLAAPGQPLQSWPLAYWPDGSVKWTGHALAASPDGGVAGEFSVAPGEPTEPSEPVEVQEDEGSVTVRTGAFTVVFNKSGTTLVQSLALSVDGAPAVTASDGQLVAWLQDAPDEPELGTSPARTRLLGNIESVAVEQDGPVRAVVKVTGRYAGGERAPFLPFTVRFYVSAGARALRVVHFFIYDGDQNHDFIKGLGFTFSTPLGDELYDRHVRFATLPGSTGAGATSATADGDGEGDVGIFGEAVRGVYGLRRDPGTAVTQAQFGGTPAPPLATWPTTVSSELDQLPIWADYTLDQLAPSYYSLAKRTSAGRAASWVPCSGAAGARAAGTGFVGGARGGGVHFGLREFWEKAPAALDVCGAGGDAADITVWAYSPRAPALDMRHYDTVPHGLDLTYEDVGDPDPSPAGVGRSYELTIQLEQDVPSRAALAGFARAVTKVAQPIASPEFYAAHKLFGGMWMVPKEGVAPKIEQKLDALLDFYVAEVDARGWYGFWDFGDVMHTYDQTRHAWRYDTGGYAWDNGECGSDLWLWTSFLRTGRADVFRLSAAMTRHLSEVDFHHVGPFAGLGSRHHVTHWGDGAKEARMSASSLKRPYYYLTADELTGDLMEYSLQADQSLLQWDPLRKVVPLPSGAPTRVRIGPDWTALAGNWLVQWERTGDAAWRTRLRTSMADIAGFTYGFFTGYAAAVGFFPDTGHLVDEGGEGTSSYHLSMIFGGAELMIELLDLIDDVPGFEKAWVEFCQYYNATNAQQTVRYGKGLNSAKNFPQWYAKYQAWAGARLGDDALRTAAWAILNSNTVGVWPAPTQVGGTDAPRPVTEIANVATNDSAQLSLSYIGALAWAPDQAPAAYKVEDASDDGSVLRDEESTLRDEKAGWAEKARTSRKWWRRALCIV